MCSLATMKRCTVMPHSRTRMISTSHHLYLLLQDIRIHPERYTSVKVKLFGKNKPRKYANPLTDPAYQLLIDSLERDYQTKVKQ